jgi:hypothetical protein
MPLFTNQFVVANFVIVPTGQTPVRPEDQKWFVVLSGVALFTFQGQSAADWRRDSLRLAIDLRALFRHLADQRHQGENSSLKLNNGLRSLR